MKTTSLYQFAVSGDSASFALADGTDLTLDTSQLTDDIRHALMMHGLKQKVADAAAIPRDTETGRSATNDEKIAAMVAVANRLATGEWSARPGEGTPSGGILLRALIELYPAKTREELVAYVGKLDKKQQAALRSHAKVAPIIERMRAAKASDVDTDAMLEELDD